MPVFQPPPPLDFTPLLRALELEEGRKFRAQQLQTQHDFRSQQDAQDAQVKAMRDEIADANKGIMAPGALGTEREANLRARIDQFQKLSSEQGLLVQNERTALDALKGLSVVGAGGHDASGKRREPNASELAAVETQFQALVAQNPEQADNYRSFLDAETAQRKTQLNEAEALRIRTQRASTEQALELARVRAETESSDPFLQARRQAEATVAMVNAEDSLDGIFYDESTFTIFDKTGLNRSAEDLAKIMNENRSKIRRDLVRIASGHEIATASDVLGEVERYYADRGVPRSRARVLYVDDPEAQLAVRQALFNKRFTLRTPKEHAAFLSEWRKMVNEEIAPPVKKRGLKVVPGSPGAASAPLGNLQSAPQPRTHQQRPPLPGVRRQPAAP